MQLLVVSRRWKDWKVRINSKEKKFLKNTLILLFIAFGCEKESLDISDQESIDTVVQVSIPALFMLTPVIHYIPFCVKENY